MNCKSAKNSVPLNPASGACLSSQKEKPQKLNQNPTSVIPTWSPCGILKSSSCGRASCDTTPLRRFTSSLHVLQSSRAIRKWLSEARCQWRNLQRCRRQEPPLASCQHHSAYFRSCPAIVGMCVFHVCASGASCIYQDRCITAPLMNAKMWKNVVGRLAKDEKLRDASADARTQTARLTSAEAPKHRQTQTSKLKNGRQTSTDRQSSPNVQAQTDRSTLIPTDN